MIEISSIVIGDCYTERRYASGSGKESKCSTAGSDHFQAGGADTWAHMFTDIRGVQFLWGLEFESELRRATVLRSLAPSHGFSIRKASLDELYLSTGFEGSNIPNHARGRGEKTSPSSMIILSVSGLISHRHEILETNCGGIQEHIPSMLENMFRLIAKSPGSRNHNKVKKIFLLFLFFSNLRQPKCFKYRSTQTRTQAAGNASIHGEI